MGNEYNIALDCPAQSHPVRGRLPHVLCVPRAGPGQFSQEEVRLLGSGDVGHAQMSPSWRAGAPVSLSYKLS